MFFNSTGRFTPYIFSLSIVDLLLVFINWAVCRVEKYIGGVDLVSEQQRKTKNSSRFLWPNVSEPDDALDVAKGTQFIAYWIGGSYIVLGYLGDANTNIIIGIIIAALGLCVWRNILWLVPIISTIGIIEAGAKLSLLLMFGRASGLIIAGIVFLYSIHGWRSWLALRKQAKSSSVS